MENFKLALIQARSILGRTCENLEAMRHWISQAHQKGASLVCFPELSISGHGGTSVMIHEAQAVPEGAACQSLVALAKELGIYICAGIAESEKGVFYNCQFIVGPEGFVGKQRKVHLSQDEYFYFRHGTNISVFRLPFGNVGIVICYDNLISEVSRCLAVDGAEVLLCPHAVRFGKWTHEADEQRKAVTGVKKDWSLVHACRAYDNGIYVALCNMVGRSAVGIKNVEANHAGGCMVFAPNGDVVTESRSLDISEELVMADIDQSMVTSRRESACFNLRTRRPESFESLTISTH